MILDVKQLSHSYGDKEALNNLNFSIKDNSIVSVLGPSGCGKTTLIRIIAGLEHIQSGEIFLDKLHNNFKKPQSLKAKPPFKHIPKQG